MELLHVHMHVRAHTSGSSFKTSTKYAKHRPLSGSSAPINHYGKRQHYELKIVKERLTFQVRDILLNHLRKSDPPTAIYLPGAGQTRLAGETQQIMRAIQVHFIGEWWARTDQRHVSFKHIPELRQLVYARLANEPPHLGDTGILPELVGHIRVTVQRASPYEARGSFLVHSGFDIVIHRTEFVEIELASVDAEA